MNAGHTPLTLIRNAIRAEYLASEVSVINRLAAESALSQNARQSISERAVSLIEYVRNEATPSMMEKFLSEYGLSTKEGVALMCLAEALLRVPDAITIDALIEDKIASGRWGDHRGHSDSSLINSATWALLLTGELLTPQQQKGISGTLRGLVKRVGEPVIRSAVAQAMKEMGRQFVLGRDIEEARKRAAKREAKGYTYSYDMLGEAARTEADAVRYHRAYMTSIKALAPSATANNIRRNPGISVKLSALHPRYEVAQHRRVMSELVPRVVELAIAAKAANMGFNIDAEEADRLDLSLDVIEAVIADPRLVDWDGFGVVVQAYGKRARLVIDWLYALAVQLDRRIMVRLVKGAYWDAEVKRTQVMGLADFPVFTRKANTDLSYLVCAERLLGMRDRIYPQFATHNAHTVSAILEMAGDVESFEFQRLHGMGESLHDALVTRFSAQCRIYAPVGAHRDLLAYLVRRLLENGANSSFVNQLVDKRIAPQQVAADPFDIVAALGDNPGSTIITKPADLFGAGRANSIGWDTTDVTTLAQLDQARGLFRKSQWQAKPLIAGEISGVDAYTVYNPADQDDLVGEVIEATPADVETAIAVAIEAQREWAARSQQERSEIISRVGELLEQNSAELFALATREAGKTLNDGVAEVREAVDFAYYYAGEALKITTPARGVVACISPWNFPLAIFSGQVLAALSVGNAVVAKPAEQTVLMAHRAVELMHQAGVPAAVLQLLPGQGDVVGAALTSDARIAAVCFTGSTDTAKLIDRAMAMNLPADAPLIAETGGLNAMIVDSTALPEQVVRDVLASSFQSAGQRCSALRVLFLQEDIADRLLEMLFGAMDELRLGNPWELSTDVGPVIDLDARAGIEAHCRRMASEGRVLKRLQVPEKGTFVAPTVVKLDAISQLEREIFGPVLHVITFKAADIDRVVDQINATGYGLTFGLHTRVDKRVDQICSRIRVGNIYVNRNQIGAIVGSQPFGGEGLSGTGPKAGGPHYLKRFTLSGSVSTDRIVSGAPIDPQRVQAAINGLPKGRWLPAQQRQAWLQTFSSKAAQALDCEPMQLPGPTGELNLLSCAARGVVLCLGPSPSALIDQVVAALAQGNAVVAIAQHASSTLEQMIAKGAPVIALEGVLDPTALEVLNGFKAVCTSAVVDQLGDYRQALASRTGELLPLINDPTDAGRFVLERHLCIDTTAAGGNASLIAASE